MNNALSRVSSFVANNYEDVLINVERVCSYIPRVSKVVGLIGIFQRIVLFQLVSEQTIAKSRYLTHIKQQPLFRFAILLDNYGYIFVAIYDFYQYQKRNCRDGVLGQVSSNGLSLKDASEDLKNDKEIVLTAIRQNYQAANEAGRRLKFDKSFWVEAIKINSNVIEYLPVWLEEDPEFKKKSYSLNTLTPKNIVEFLDETISGQQKAKESLAVGVWRHFQRINSNQKVNSRFKSNVIIFGPTGSGKTLMVETIAKLLNVPYYCADATKITPSGYIGENIEEVMRHLYHRSNKNLERTQKGILYIDEIDKLKKNTGSIDGGSRDATFKTVLIQQTLLKVIEGTKISLDGKMASLGPIQAFFGNPVEIDTSNILIIVSGAFIGLENNVYNRLSAIAPDINIDKDWLLANANAADFISYGLIPEFVGRFSTFAHVNQLPVSEMVKILTNKENGIVTHYVELFKEKGIELKFTEAALQAIAVKANGFQTGARALDTVTNTLMSPIILQYLSSNEFSMIQIEGFTVLRGDAPVLVPRSSSSSLTENKENN